jgi:ABC-type uncharacterized transport system permease subunit
VITETSLQTTLNGASAWLQFGRGCQMLNRLDLSTSVFLLYANQAFFYAEIYQISLCKDFWAKQLEASVLLFKELHTKGYIPMTIYLA